MNVRSTASARSARAVGWLSTAIGSILAISIGAELAAEEPTRPPVTEHPEWREKVVTIGNGTVQVGADALNGGRLVEYSLAGHNALYVDPDHPAEVFPEADSWMGPAAGRFDIGPEESVPVHDVLWYRAWSIEKPDPQHLRMTSSIDAASGVQLTRDLVLDGGSTHLRCTQTMVNRTDRPLRRAYWGRTMVHGGGIFVTAVTPGSRFPNRYLEADGYPDFRIFFQPADPVVTFQDDLLMLRGVPIHAKLGFDTTCGWLAYLMPSGQLFVKRFLSYPDRRYADIAGLTISVWSLQDRIVELEPLGPEELLAPGQSAVFSEDWWLLAYPFPAPGENVDLARIRAFVGEHTVAPPP